MIDVQHQLNAVRRSVGRKTFEAREARVVSVSQTYDTDAADLWDACTSIERIPRWFLPVTGDLQLGGRFQLEGNASGEVLSCDPPRTFTTTWEAMGATSWVEVSRPEPASLPQSSVSGTEAVVYQGPPLRATLCPVGAATSFVTVKVAVAVPPAPLVTVTVCAPEAVVLWSQV